MLSSSSSEIDKSTVNGFMGVRLMTFVVDIVLLLVSCCYVRFSSEFFLDLGTLS